MNYEGSSTVSKHEISCPTVCEKYLDDPYNTWIFPGI